MFKINRGSQVLLEQISCMNSLCHVGEKKYTPEMIGRAFEYFAISRSLYRRLREDYELPSITMLTKLTSKVSNLDGNDFIFFGNISDVRQKNVTLLIDEIYVKPSLTYRGENIFGKAVNKPLHMATTVLSFMICCMFGGKKILYKTLPVFRLDAEFQYQQTLLILNGIRNSGGTVIAILCDNNRVNQNCNTLAHQRQHIFVI